MTFSLAKFFGRKKLEFRLVEPSRYAHLVVDVQRNFCDPLAGKRGTRETDAVASEISRITPVFRNAGMPTYLIFCQKWSEPADKAFGGFHKIQPAPTDILFGKISESAFEYSDLAETLKKAGTKTLIVSGFNTSACVNATVQGGLSEDFDVWVLKDCIANGKNFPKPEPFLDLMRDRGAQLMTSRQALKRLQTPAAP